MVGWSKTEALLVTISGLTIYALLCPLAEIVGDRIGRRRTTIIGGLGLGIVAIPSFLLIGTGHFVLSFTGLVLFGVFEALVNVMLGVLLVELFQAQTRVSGASIGFNPAQATIGRSGAAGCGGPGGRHGYCSIPVLLYRGCGTRRLRSADALPAEDVGH
ncbi:MFS transporter [Streptomyces sp. NPDC056663]|uniref:MFS transporter n=1 Tax=Streptomyces sp. NPDC056663 TaxID=3345899 RepID=UPI0036A19183